MLTLKYKIRRDFQQKTHRLKREYYRINTNILKRPKHLILYSIELNPPQKAVSLSTHYLKKRLTLAI